MTVRSKKKSDPLSHQALTSAIKPSSLTVIYGDDDFLVAEEARKIIATLQPKGMSEFGLEMVEGLAANQTEASLIFKKLFDCLQSQSFFAAEKVIWWRNTNLLGSSPTASGAAVADFLSSLNELLQKGLPQEISLVITATDLDGRKAIAKTFQKVGKLIAFKNDPYKQQEQQAEALNFVAQEASKIGKQLTEGAKLLIVEMADGDYRTIHSELEKLAAYVGQEKTIDEEAIQAIGSWRPGGIVWDLPDALGERNLKRVLSLLDNLLFLGETPIGLLFTMISRIRLLLLLRLLIDKKLLQIVGSYPAFKSQIEKLPAWVSESLPKDKKLNPLATHPFALWKASMGARNYTFTELQAALEMLGECNERFVSGSADPRCILEESLIKICMRNAENRSQKSGARI